MATLLAIIAKKKEHIWPTHGINDSKRKRGTLEREDTELQEEKQVQYKDKKNVAVMNQGFFYSIAHGGLCGNIFKKGGEMAETADSWRILQNLQAWRFRIVEASTKVIRGGPKCPHHFQKITGKTFELSSFTCLQITVERLEIGTNGSSPVQIRTMSWGNSRGWVLELRDGRQVVIPPSLYRLTESLTDFTGSEDDSGVAWDALSFDESYKGSLKQHVYQGAEKKNYDEYQESILEIKKSKKGDNFESWTE
ncbi:hypothetical protein CMV_024076 [Castanea mollissima]|uniref:Uncharacterized protein n=1 Tax=Castanea mollissima TaxID=60419 RepID=A0A8J4VIC0_9ROSI|nr:hypothetical protein CMV_024076 [Castanea mollissima]